MTQPVRTRRGLVPHRQPGPVRRGRRSARWPPSRGQIAATLDGTDAIPATVVWKPVLTDADAIRRIALEANADDRLRRRRSPGCTRSPRPRCGSAASTRCASRCCTCTRRPTSSCRGPTIDMDFMNLNQAAHGDREFGYIQTRLGVSAQDRRRSRQRPGGRRPDRHLGAGRDGELRHADHAAGPLRRQHARRGRHRGRQGRGRAALRRLGQHLRRQRPGGRRRRRRPTATSTRWSTRVRGRVRRGRPSCAPAASGTSRCATAPASSWACGRFLERRRVRRVHHQLRGPRRAAAAARPRRAAPDGRRLRLRRRGRLEDVGPAADAEGHGAGPAGRHVLHGGLHLPPDARRGEDPRRAHARGLPVHRGRPAAPRDPPARHRRPRGPGPAGVRRGPGPGGRPRHVRHGRAVPARGQRG